MIPHLLYVVNPVSGKGQAKTSLFPVLDVFAKAGWMSSVFITQEKGEAARIAQEYGADYSLVVCSGGDGTLNEVVNGSCAAPSSRRSLVSCRERFDLRPATRYRRSM
jgi:diacylglycerol kinase family enzyme